MNVIGLINEGIINGDIILEYKMPSSISDYEYSTYFSSNNLCTLINELSVVDCMELNTQGIITDGAYLSGGDLKIKVKKTPASTSVLMSN